MAGSGFEATGQFGIGFFSVFMLGDQVKVTTLRYEHGHDQCQVLEFRDGLRQRALLREPLGDEKLKRCGTRVSVRLKKKVLEGLLTIHNRYDNEFKTYSLNEIVRALVPALDIAVRSQNCTQGWISCVMPNDWQALEDMTLLYRIWPFVERFVSDEHPQDIALMPVTATDGTLLGRCSLEGDDPSGILVVNGIYAGNVDEIEGLLIAGNNFDLARTRALPIAGIREMAEWANRQRQRLRPHNCTSLALTSSILALGGEVADLPLLENFTQPLDQESIRELVANNNELWLSWSMFSFNSEYDEGFSQDEFRKDFQAKDHCLQEHLRWHGVSFLEYRLDWPVADDILKPRSIEDVIVTILIEVWGGFEKEEPYEPQVVGEVNGKPVRRRVRIYRKSP